jgi:hypothetical protein
MTECQVQLDGDYWLKYLPIKNLHVKIGRAKTSFKIATVVEHPLLSLGMQKYNVALVKLYKKRSPEIKNQCIITKTQFRSISKILPNNTFLLMLSYYTVNPFGDSPKRNEVILAFLIAP